MSLKNIIIWLLKFYKKNISIMFYGSCRYTPSCSEYFMEAVEIFGVLKGSLKGILRLLRCNIFFKGGYDPVLKNKPKN